jgi:hypothetical protein
MLQVKRLTEIILPIASRDILENVVSYITTSRGEQESYSELNSTGAE